MAKETSTTVTTSTKSDTQVLNHNCQNAYMDEKYGRFMRVMNKSAKGWRCCACGEIKK